MMFAVQSALAGRLLRRRVALRVIGANEAEPQPAPSKRVGNLVAGDEKPLLGNLAVLAIGLDAIRQQCPHFRQWIERMETWAR